MIYATVFLILLLLLLGLPLFMVIALASLLAFNWSWVSTNIYIGFQKVTSLVIGDLENFRELIFLRPEGEDFAIFIEMIRLKDTPILLAIPLFTFAGFLLSNSKAPQRIVSLTQLLFGWMPGSLAVISIIACSLLTAFTGASGVTIIALGGLLYPTLIKQGYKESFVTGLLTTAGSRGLLFPPSLPLILFAVVIEESIDGLFKSCLVPGLIGIGVMILYSLLQGKQFKSEVNTQENHESKSLENKTSFFKRLLKSSFELPIPIIVLGGIYGGFITVTEAAGITVLYVIIVEVLILREISFFKDLPKIMVDSMVLVGSILIILSFSLGFTYYLVEEQIPTLLLEWIKTHIESKIAFLLILNLLLFVVGCLMDIFSAILIVVPLIYPIATELGIHPFHLGAIFLMNLEIGYSTPPVGLNLFIASARFKKSIFYLYKSTFPFLLLLFLVLMLITFFPFLSLWHLQ